MMAKFSLKNLVPLSIGALTGFILRDEYNMPTNQRILVALQEKAKVTREKIDIDLVEIIDPSLAQQNIQDKFKFND